MTDVRQQITDYIAQLNQAQTPDERSLAYRQLMNYHYFLPEAERLATDDLMRPYWDKLDKIQLPPDPLLERAQELLKRIQSRVVQS